jgi:hypothetical protein
MGSRQGSSASAWQQPPELKSQNEISYSKELTDSSIAQPWRDYKLGGQVAAQ